MRGRRELYRTVGTMLNEGVDVAWRNHTDQMEILEYVFIGQPLIIIFIAQVLCVMKSSLIEGLFVSCLLFVYIFIPIGFVAHLYIDRYKKRRNGTRYPGKVLGMSSEYAAAFSYTLGFVSGFIVLLSSGQNKFTRFHALQSTIIFGAVFAAKVLTTKLPIPYGLQTLLLSFISLIALIAWVVGIYKARKGDIIQFPIVSAFVVK